VGGYWSSGLPYLDAAVKATPTPWDGGLQVGGAAAGQEGAGPARLSGHPSARWCTHPARLRARRGCAELSSGSRCRPKRHHSVTSGPRSQVPLLHLDVSEAKAFLQSMHPDTWTHEWQAEHSAVMGGRDTNMNAFKPGVQGITLLFSAGSGEGDVFEFPLYKKLAPALDPLIQEVGPRGRHCRGGGER
jgi:hypothetical protein